MSGKREIVPETEHDDRKLVKRMLAGEEQAFEEFFEGHFARLYRFALPRVGQDADAAKEVVQAALCKAISALKSWRGEAALFTWICTFCRHEISGHYRRNGRAPQAMGLIEGSPDTGPGLVRLAERPGRAPDDEAQRRDVARLVQETLDILPARYGNARSEEHTSELQSPCNLVCRLLLEKKKKHNRLTTLNT